MYMQQKSVSSHDLVYFHCFQLDLLGLLQSYYFTPTIIHLIIKMSGTIADKKLLCK